MYLMMRAIGEMLYMDPDHHTLYQLYHQVSRKVGVIFQDGPTEAAHEKRTKTRCLVVTVGR